MKGLISAIVGIVGVLLKWWHNHFSQKKRRQKEAVKDGKEAVDDGDASGITAAFDRMRR